MDAVLPLALTALHGYGPAAAGVPLTTGAVGWALASQWQGRHPGASRVRLLGVGFLLVAAGLGGTAAVAVPGAGGWPAYLAWGVAGLGMGLGMPSLSVLLLAASPEHRRGTDSAALQIADVTGSAICIGLTGVLVAAATAGAFPLRVAVLVAVAGCTGLALAGAAASSRAGGPPALAAGGSAVTLARP